MEASQASGTGPIPVSRSTVACGSKVTGSCGSRIPLHTFLPHPPPIKPKKAHKPQENPPPTTRQKYPHSSYHKTQTPADHVSPAPPFRACRLRKKFVIFSLQIINLAACRPHKASPLNYSIYATPARARHPAEQRRAQYMGMACGGAHNQPIRSFQDKRKIACNAKSASP